MLIIAGASYMDSVYVLANSKLRQSRISMPIEFLNSASGSKFDITKAAYGKSFR
jgi:hypothetical protein